MAKSKLVKPKKRGRPATGKDPLYAVRIPDALVLAIDRWAGRNDSPSRSDAIRRLLERGLGGAATARPRDKGSRRRAAEMAARQIDQLSDRAATDEERAQRKRRLIKGPKEFRDMRGDLPKTKT
jgi:Arc/MetJ-type ribon-helix-helix transcriptional regulator